MGQIHELLAVEPEVKSAASNVQQETHTTFVHKKEHFIGITRTYDPVNEDGEKLGDENKELITTVRQKLDHTHKLLERAWDLAYQKELANCEAKADIIVNGKVLAESVPATMLLQLEKQLRELKNVYHSIPTLTPGPAWRRTEENPDVWVHEKPRKARTQKRTEPRIVVEATDKHPAQVREYTEDVTVGYWNEKVLSGEWTVGEKSGICERLEDLINAVKTARARANQQEVKNDHIATKLFDYVLGN